MVEQAYPAIVVETPDEGFSPTPWWIKYRKNVGGNICEGILCGWRYADLSNEVYIALAQEFTMVPGRRLPDAAGVRVIADDDIVQQGPMLMGVKVSEEEFQKIQQKHTVGAETNPCADIDTMSGGQNGRPADADGDPLSRP